MDMNDLHILTKFDDKNTYISHTACYIILLPRSVSRVVTRLRVMSCLL